MTLPVGHDAWVVGNEPVVASDWFGATHYAKKRKPETVAWKGGPR